MKGIQNKSSFLSVPFIFSIICIPLAYIPLTSIHREHKFPKQTFILISLESKCLYLINL